MFEQSGIRGVIINSRISEVFRKKIFCLQKAVKKASNRSGRQLNALLSKLETGPRYRSNIISISISYSFVSFFRGFAFLTGVYVEYSLQNRFVFFYFPLWSVRNGEHAHYVGLVVVYTWNREKKMFIALGKEFDMITFTYYTWIRTWIFHVNCRVFFNWPHWRLIGKYD